MTEPPKPRESAQQIADRIRRGEKPDPDRISNINQRREKEADDEKPV